MPRLRKQRGLGARLVERFSCMCFWDFDRLYTPLVSSTVVFLGYWFANLQAAVGPSHVYVSIYKNLAGSHVDSARSLRTTLDSRIIVASYRVRIPGTSIPLTRHLSCALLIPGFHLIPLSTSPIEMQKRIRLASLLVPQDPPQFGFAESRQLLHVLHLAHDVLERMTLHARDRAQHLDRRDVLHFRPERHAGRGERGRGRAFEHGRVLLGLVVVQFEVREDPDRLVWGRRPDDAEFREVEGEEHELGLQEEGIPVFFFRFVASRGFALRILSRLGRLSARARVTSYPCTGLTRRLKRSSSNSMRSMQIS
jgi:hypothetical protein